MALRQMSWSVLHWTARSLAQHEFRPLVRGAAGEGFMGPVRPEHVDAVHVTDRTQAEVCPRVVAAQVAVTRVDPPHPAAPACPDRNLSTVGVALKGGVDGAN